MRFEVTDEERRLLTTDDGVVVAWFDDPAMAVRVARLLNADEARAHPLLAQREEATCANPVCRHPRSLHRGAEMYSHACLSPDPTCTCIHFEEAT